MNKRILTIALVTSIVGAGGAALAIHSADDTQKNTGNCPEGQLYVEEMPACLTVRYQGRTATGDELRALDTANGWTIQILDNYFLFDSEAAYRKASNALPPQAKLTPDVTAAALERRYPALAGSPEVSSPVY